MYPSKLQTTKYLSPTLKSYLQRQPSFPADILNAFSRICQAFSAISGGSFFWGLPEAAFNSAFCWTLAGGGKRNRHSCVVYDAEGKATNVEFPSWSWAAWFGTQDLAWLSWDVDYSHAEVEIVFYKLDDLMIQIVL